MQTVNIGSTRPLKTPDAIPATAHDTEYVLDPGSYPVTVRPVNWSNVILRSIDPVRTSVLTNTQNKPFGLWQFVGKSSATLRNLGVMFGSNNGVVAQTKDYACLTLDGIMQNTGCLYWGSGGVDVVLENCSSTGKPWKYYICNFDSVLHSLNVNFDPTKIVYQGDNESALRLMQTTSFYAKGMTFQYSVGSDGKPWKQEFALRSGGKLCMEDCIAHQGALGWMADPAIPPPTTPIQLVQFIGGSYTVAPVLGSSLAKVQYSNTTVAGVLHKTN